jgi:hypothetical protein
MVAVAKMDGSHNIITLGLSKEAAGILAPKLQKRGASASDEKDAGGTQEMAGDFS